MTHKSIEVAREEIEVGKREVETGRVRVRKVVHEREHLVAEPLAATHVEVERVALNRLVDELPTTREDGDLLVVPVMEEVVIKKWLLKEELRIRRKTVVTPHEERVKLKEEEVIVERTSERH